MKATVRKVRVGTYTKELRKVLTQEIRSDLWWCMDDKESATVVNGIVKCIRRLNKKYFCIYYKNNICEEDLC